MIPHGGSSGTLFPQGGAARSYRESPQLLQWSSRRMSRLDDQNPETPPHTVISCCSDVSPKHGQALGRLAQSQQRSECNIPVPHHDAQCCDMSQAAQPELDDIWQAVGPVGIGAGKTSRSLPSPMIPFTCLQAISQGSARLGTALLAGVQGSSLLNAVLRVCRPTNFLVCFSRVSA